MISYKKFLVYVCTVLLLLNCHSVYEVGNIDCHFDILCIFFTLLLIITSGGHLLSGSAIKLILGWMLFNVPILVYCNSVSDYAFTYLVKYILYPILIFALLYMNENMLECILKAFINTVCTIALITLFFYCFATIWHIITPTGSFYINWNPARYVDSYFGIYFEVSGGHVFDYKNAAIYSESTIFAAILCVALATELYIVESHGKKHVFRMLLLIVTILTTFSSGSYFAMLICVFGIIWKNYRRLPKKVRMITFFVVVLLAGVVAYAIWIIFMRKKTAIGQSYLVRVDDYLVAWNVLRRHPLLGVGFGVTNYTKQYMSVQRIATGNYGQSSDMAALVASGGIYFITSYIIGFLGLSRMINEKSNRIIYISALVTIFAVSRIGATLFFVLFISAGIVNFSKRDKTIWVQSR